MKFKVLCEVCKFEKNYKHEEKALNIALMHKAGFHDLKALKKRLSE